MYLSAEENLRIVSSIREAEMRTSGEIRVFIETRCEYVNALDRAADVFFGLKMDLTENRNAVLIYVAFDDNQAAIFADEGIYRELGAEFWDERMKVMLDYFRKMDYVDGILAAVKEVGEALRAKFPFEREVDRNELPDNIVFGR